MDWFEPNQRSHGFEPQPGYWETLPRYRLTFPAGGVDEPVAQLRGVQHDDVQMEYWTNSYDGDVMLYIAGDGHFAAQLGDCAFLAGPRRSALSELNRSEARVASRRAAPFLHIFSFPFLHIFSNFQFFKRLRILEFPNLIPNVQGAGNPELASSRQPRTYSVPPCSVPLIPNVHRRRNPER